MVPQTRAAMNPGTGPCTRDSALLRNLSEAAESQILWDRDLGTERPMAMLNWGFRLRHTAGRRQAGYWSWRAHTSIHSSSVNLRPAERMSASSWKYFSRGGPGANRMSIRAGAPLSLEKA